LASRLWKEYEQHRIILYHICHNSSNKSKYNIWNKIWRISKKKNLLCNRYFGMVVHFFFDWICSFTKFLFDKVR
jgi:hypothetical protein